jgi:hypothetical protein
MNNYTCLKQQIFKYRDYHVEPYRYEDLARIKDWRNSQVIVLRQKNILTDEDQLKYYNSFIKPSFLQVHPSIILFSFFYQNDPIGYGGLTNCSWDDRRSELSFLVDPRRIHDNDIYQTDFSSFIQLMKQVNFQELNFNRLYTETFDIRPHHVSILESNGFALEGRMKEHVRIEDKFVDSLIHACLQSHYRPPSRDTP